jgi:hypothetical protein
VALLDFLLQELQVWLGTAMQNGQSNHNWNKFHHYSFLELVQSVRLEHWGEGLAACSDETVAAHWVKVLAAEASASGSSSIVLENSVAASGI